MCEQSNSANEVQRQAECLSQACVRLTPKSYREYLDETLNEETPNWADELLKKLD